MKLINQFPKVLSVATQSQNGLFEATDKRKLDNMYILSYESSEPANVNDKQVWIGDE